MGTWGASIYDDDFARDLKNTIALICKVPAEGDRLLELLIPTQASVDPEDDEGALFWLVVADQFERRGISCELAASTALRLIDSGTDLANCEVKGADARFLRERQEALLQLADRLRRPRPQRVPRKKGRPPPLVLETGQVYSFPTMFGRSWHPYRLKSDVAFSPDGWGALVVLATGRLWDWLPWVALASLTVKPDAKPTFDEAVRGQLIAHPQTHGAGRFVPKPAHARGLGLELLGSTELDETRVKPHLSKLPVETAIEWDWSIAYGALSAAVVGKGADAGPVLGDLRRRHS